MNAEAEKEVKLTYEEKRSVIAGVAIAGTVLNGLAGFFSGINGPNNVKDVRMNKYSTLYALYSIVYSLYIFYSLHSLLYVLHFILYTLYYIIYTPYCILYALYSMCYTLCTKLYTV